MGKKYFFELLDECESQFKGIMVFGLTPRNQISAEIIPEESLTPYTEPDLEQVRKEAYQQGLSDAKEGKATCQYCEYQYLDDTEEPCKKCCKAYVNKYKPKAKEKQIQVGDEYCYAGKYRCVITGITDSFYRILWSCGTSGVIDELTYMKPTGRHFPEIAEVLQKMKEKE